MDRQTILTLNAMAGGAGATLKNHGPLNGPVAAYVTHDDLRRAGLTADHVPHLTISHPYGGRPRCYGAEEREMRASVEDWEAQARDRETIADYAQEQVPTMSPARARAFADAVVDSTFSRLDKQLTQRVTDRRAHLARKASK